MTASATGAFDESFAFQTVIDAALAAGVVYVLGSPPQTAAAAGVAVAVASAGTQYADGLGVRDPAVQTVLGVVVAAGAVAWVAASPGVLPALAVLASAWLLLDGAVTLTYGTEDRASDTPAIDAYVGESVVDDATAFAWLGEVARELEADPGTPRDLAARLDRPTEDVQDALDVLEEAGTAERDGDTYRLTDAGWRVRSWPRRVLGRVLRPFTLLAAKR